MPRQPVIFVTPGFEDVTNGPCLYGRYLWQAFRDDPEFDFHVVASHFAFDDPQLHPVHRQGWALLFAVQRKALELAAAFGRPPIVHGNVPQAMFKFCHYRGPWAVQINDYESADSIRQPWQVVRRSGPRRLASLLWRRQQEGRVVRAATRVICNSQFTLGKIIEHYRPAHPDRLVTIYKAVDVADFVRPATLPLDPCSHLPGGPRLLFVGTNWRLKGLADLVAAMPRIVSAGPPATLLVAGPSDGGSRHAIAALARKHGVESRVCLLGRIERRDLPNLYWHSDVFVLPSLCEAFGVAVIEALAAGVPVAASAVGGLQEIIRPQIDGVQFPPGQPEVIAEAVAALLRDVSLRRRLEEAGPDRARSFSLQRMIDGVRRVYHELTPGHGSRAG